LSFSEKLCKGLSRPDFKFVSQMMYGLLAGQSCHLSKIARAIGEDIALKKTIDRLSRNLGAFAGGAVLFENCVRAAKGYFSDRTILIVDDSDTTKPCSRKLEGLGTARDGSTGEYGTGCHTIGAAALTPDKR
jgi:hypothetical protein